MVQEAHVTYFSIVNDQSRNQRTRAKVQKFIVTDQNTFPLPPNPCFVHANPSLRVLYPEHVFGAVCKCVCIDYCCKYAYRVSLETSLISLDPDIKKDREFTG